MTFLALGRLDPRIRKLHQTPLGGGGGVLTLMVSMWRNNRRQVTMTSAATPSLPSARMCCSSALRALQSILALLSATEVRHAPCAGDFINRALHYSIFKFREELCYPQQSLDCPLQRQTHQQRIPVLKAALLPMHPLAGQLINLALQTEINAWSTENSASASLSRLCRLSRHRLQPSNYSTSGDSVIAVPQGRGHHQGQGGGRLLRRVGGRAPQHGLQHHGGPQQPQGGVPHVVAQRRVQPPAHAAHAVVGHHAADGRQPEQPAGHHRPPLALHRFWPAC